MVVSVKHDGSRRLAILFLLFVCTLMFQRSKIGIHAIKGGFVISRVHAVLPPRFRCSERLDIFRTRRVMVELVGQLWLVRDNTSSEAISSSPFDKIDVEHDHG